MASSCKVNYISKICTEYCGGKIQAPEAMKQIQAIIARKDEEMPPCNCNTGEKRGENTCSIERKEKRQPLSIAIFYDTEENPVNQESPESCAKDDLCGPMCGLCQKPGPMTNNSYFNFMREMRANACYNTTVNKVAKEASAKWSKMSDLEKSKYIQQAHEVSMQNQARMKRSCEKTSDSGPARKIAKRK